MTYKTKRDHLKFKIKQLELRDGCILNNIDWKSCHDPMLYDHLFRNNFGTGKDILGPE